MGHLRITLVLLSCTIASAASDGKPEPAIIKVSGSSGVVAFKPEKARVLLEISNAAGTQAAAETENSRFREALIEDIRKELGPTASRQSKIELVGYTIAPGYKSTPSDVIAYVVRSAVCDDFSRLGTISQLAGKNSGRLAEIEYSLKDDQEALSYVVRRAAVIARSNAESMSAALGQKILRVRSLESTPGRVGPLPKGDLLPHAIPSAGMIPRNTRWITESSLKQLSL